MRRLTLVLLPVLLVWLVRAFDPEGAWEGDPPGHTSADARADAPDGHTRAEALGAAPDGLTRADALGDRPGPQF